MMNPPKTENHGHFQLWILIHRSSGAPWHDGCPPSCPVIRTQISWINWHWKYDRPIIPTFFHAKLKLGWNKPHEHPWAIIYIGHQKAIFLCECKKKNDSPFSWMRSKGSRFTLGVWGLSCVRRTLLNRPQSFAAVRKRSQPFATVRVRAVWPCLW